MWHWQYYYLEKFQASGFGGWFCFGLGVFKIILIVTIKTGKILIFQYLFTFKIK